MKMYITVGISASGKTTWANDQVKQNPSIVNINRDTIRFTKITPAGDWSTYKFTKTRERKVTDIANEMFEEAVLKASDVIISDTNLNPKTRQYWIDRGYAAGYEVEIVNFPVSMEEAWKRDNARSNGVGHSVIANQYKQWNEYIGRKTYTPDTSKPKAIIVDVDGTIADKNDRGPFEWSKVGQDTPREMVIMMIRSYMKAANAKVIFLSGRDSVCRTETDEWIKEHAFMHIGQKLFMRAENDMRKDTEIKEELFWNHIADNYNVIAAFDDRPVVVRNWNFIGIPNVIAVADQTIEF